MNYSPETTFLYHPVFNLFVWWMDWGSAEMLLTEMQFILYSGGERDINTSCY
jgi:hypothetical protein